MPDAVPLHRFQEFGELTAAETAAVVALGDPPRHYARNQAIRREGEPVAEFFLLVSGWAISSTLLPNGGRQILKIHLPGDVLGSPSMCSDRAVESLTAATTASVSVVPLKRIGALMEAHPRVAGYFLLSVQRERVSLMDQLASMGRTPADARLAAFLLDLADRLAPTAAVEADGFDLCLTQEQVGDTLGLTPVHVNRMLRALVARNLIKRVGHRVAILDRAAMSMLAARPNRPLRTQLDWLPASRAETAFAD